MAAGKAQWPYVINLGNSIIGVSVLAMPYCFKQCGVVLGMLLLLGAAWLTNISCSLLMKAAITSKKRSYEYLAFHTFGAAGKLAVEMSIIGMLIGTCVAFHAIIGDVGPAIVSKITGLPNTENLRTGLMVFLGLCVALPLGLLKSLDSLSNVSAISIGFYAVFVAEVFATSFPNLWSGIWVTKVEIWNPQGVFKCLPIFALAFGCQTQLFVMYDALPEPSLKTMSKITKNAVTLCTSVYLAVGYFGYVAFCQDSIQGDVLMNFKPTIFVEAIKFGFVLSVAISFPLVIFPCRASIYTLLFAKHQSLHEHFGGGPYMPDLHFKVITVFIVVGTLIIGIMVPNIEFILGLTGATMGAMICFIFPAVMYINVMSLSKTNSKSVAQLVLFLGVTILLASTYVTLYSQDKAIPGEKLELPKPAVDAAPGDVLPGKPEPEEPKDGKSKDNENPVKEKPPDKESEKKVTVKEEKDAAKEDKKDGEEDEKRQEPPNPHAPDDNEENKDVNDAKDDKVVKEDEKEGAGDKDDKQEGDTGKEQVKRDDLVEEVKKTASPLKSDSQEQKGKQAAEKAEVKVEKEKAEAAQKEAKHLISELKKQQQEQKVLLNEQKKIIQELKDHQKEHQEQAKVGAQAAGEAVQQQANQQPNVQQANIPPQANVQAQPANNQMNIPQQGMNIPQQGNLQQQAAGQQVQANVQPNQVNVQPQAGGAPQAQGAGLPGQVANMQAQQGGNPQAVNMLPQGNVGQQQANAGQPLANVGQPQGNVVQQQGNMMQQQGNVVQQQGNIVQQQGNVVQQQGNVVQQPGNIVQQQGNMLSQHGNIAPQQGNVGVQQQQQQANVQQQAKAGIVGNGVNQQGFQQQHAPQQNGHNLQAPEMNQNQLNVQNAQKVVNSNQGMPLAKDNAKQMLVPNQQQNAAAGQDSIPGMAPAPAKHQVAHDINKNDKLIENILNQKQRIPDNVQLLPKQHVDAPHKPVPEQVDVEQPAQQGAGLQQGS